MGIQSWAVLSAAQFATAQNKDDDDNCRVPTKPVTAASPGVGLNLNPDAADFDPGDVIPLVDMYVIPQRMVTSPESAIYAPDLVDYLKTMPWAQLDDEVIFAPEE